MFVQKRAHWNTPGHYLCLQVSGKKLSQHSEVSVSISGNLFSLREKSVLISNSVSCKIWTGCHYANKSMFQVCVLAGFVTKLSQFGQAWRERAHTTYPAVEQLLLDKVAWGQPRSYCSGADEAPWLQATYYVKPQCSNLLDLSPLETSKHISSQGWLCPLMRNQEGGSTSLCSVEPSAHLLLVAKARDIQDNWETLLFSQVYFHQHKEGIII